MKKPFVSCIMPTYNRRAFVPHAIRYFMRQDHSAKELIIIDDGTDCIADLVPDHPAIHYCRLEEKISLGAKLNMACRQAKGNIIANWDDDDWYAPGRLTYQVQALESDEMSVCGINTLLYFDVNRKTGFQYIYPSNQRTWLLGSSLCYKKELWQENKFADINVGMDGLFIFATPPQQVKVLEDHNFSVHMIHDNNVCPKKTDGGWWHPYPVTRLEKLMNDDWHVYSNGSLFHSNGIAEGYKAQPLPSIQPTKSDALPVKNIFACLVHENEDCIIDLVRNLHYHDPGSIILLYNGGENSDLFKNHNLYEKFGVIFHPHPVPVKHGYLHDFALKCMQFARDNFNFDTFTIVDSDQLLIRSGYSGYLGEFLRDHQGTGMLSSAPARIDPNNKTNYTALQAFKEYDLWKPLLQSFPGGESKFVHWTFWPSTVFTSNAVIDLIKLFRENELLQLIMQKTKIWATEEVILPTLVRLLGYEIELNPCNYDFVKYKVSHAVENMGLALNRKSVFWIHPVERKYDNALRKYLRLQFKHYGRENIPDTESGHIDIPGPLSLYKKIQEIKGWLEENEADLILTTIFKACLAFPGKHTIVEIGCYHGKLTVLMGSIVKKFFPHVKIVAIDPHDGKLGALDQGLVSVAPSLPQFTANIQNACLTDVVEIIHDHACHVKFDGPISFLIVDGLHDYPNVARDFFQFSEHILPGGYIAFHDYADYFPGVKAFVNELLESNTYRKIQRADSLIVLQKVENINN